MKKQFLNTLKKVDINEQDWEVRLLETLPRTYEKGYLDAMVSTWNNCGEPMNEELVEEIKHWCDFIKWD